MTNFTVIGTGPAGLTAAYMLAKRGHGVVLVEPGPVAGGLWASWNDKGLIFERGMHTYVDCEIPEIDNFYRGLPIPSYQLAGEHRDRGGVYWDGYLNTKSPYIDLTRKRATWRQMLAEILVAANLDEAHADRALDRAMAMWGPTVTMDHIRPILTKLYGAGATLKGRALDLTNLTRVGIMDAEHLAPWMGIDTLRKRIAWPDRDTLPKPYLPTRSGFYPTNGMAALVKAALEHLESLGVFIEIGRDVEDLAKSQGLKLIWAAPLRPFCVLTGRTPPKPDARELTVVNFKGSIPKTGRLHYFHNYEPGHKTFRVTCYDNFTADHKTSVELLDTPGDKAADVAIAELRAMLSPYHMEVTGNLEVVGVHEMGKVLQLPTSSNDNLMDACRPQLPNLTFVGQAARPGVFFQPDVMRNVHTTINCLLQSEG